jgi:extracellular elastinolytic metalloproteinase
VTPIRNKSLTVAAIGGTALAVSMLGLPSQAATSGSSSSHASVKERGASHAAGYYDARQLTGRTLSQASRQQVSSRTNAVRSYYKSLGTQAVVSIDPLTHTVRDLGKLNGFLSQRSAAPARSVALSYVRSHLSALGLHRADLRTLTLRRDYVDPFGVHNLSWTQHAAGRTVFGNGLIVRVTRDGRVLAVQGSPVSGLAGLAAKAPTAGAVSAPQARSLAARNVDARPSRATVASSRGGASATTVWSDRDQATRVWFLTPQGLRPGWSTYVQTSKGAYQHVIDSATGRTLYRHANTSDANGDALVYDNFPGAAAGGKARVVNFLKRGWLTKSDRFLKGNSVTAFSDVNDDDAIQASEKTPVPGTKRAAQFKLKIFGPAASGFCSKFVCTWNPNVPNSWKANRAEATTNGFYFASNFHDYLAKPPISFTPAAGNFSAAGGDPVSLNTLDGANTLLDAQNNPVGLPDGNHIDNANMSTPPDGISPRMQMYLFHVPGLSDADEPFVPTTGSLDASVEYHEYTHGLSNRLVIDANGNSTLNSIQSGAMGEAWSDYYAMDYLVTNGFLKDTKKAGELLEGDYVAAGAHLIRTMAIDCPRNANTRGCRSGAIAGVHGGYVYGDFPNIIGIPEVHASGEIWSQTLWDLRAKLGHNVTDALVTRAMSLSADDPDYLDMRNAILRADLTGFNGKFRDTIWKVFANRGMGFFAGSIDSTDTTPASDFHVPPPATTPHDGVVTGTITDSVTHDPIAGALVQVTGQGDQYSTFTNAAGRYAIGGLVLGTYAKVAVSAPGSFFPNAAPGVAAEQSPNAPTDPTDIELTHDWAAEAGGARIFDFNGPDFSPQCGPEGAIDLSQGTGWGSTTGNNAGDPTNVFVPKFITVELPQPIDITEFRIDPSATCGDGLSASTGAFTIAVSVNGTTFSDVATGAFTNADDGHYNSVPPNAAATGVNFVRLTINGNQTPNFATNCPNGAFSGCSFTDLTELAVVGSPSAP